eukprot:CAMPEP_0114252630 /NCGR_PEP_ID=MMETSP0058-20121206/15940_1 /TAXON_ID=36894 /ORGANISM="Pyramimonas parkeae, CCMP726" /LENGTH=91 /DNA_ID=CAMNT_0001366579 /DNA_START=524 /DNA_END=796 /DNA_ORIENTATION=-
MALASLASLGLRDVCEFEHPQRCTEGGLLTGVPQQRLSVRNQGIARYGLPDAASCTLSYTCKLISQYGKYDSNGMKYECHLNCHTWREHMW